MELQDLEERTKLMSAQQSYDAAAEGMRPEAAKDCGTEDGAAPAEHFLCGVALSVYQTAGGRDTNWEAWEGRRNMLQPTIAVRLQRQLLACVIHAERPLSLSQCNPMQAT